MSLEEVYQQCMDCGMCALCESGGPKVFGKGPADAEVMYVGDYPEACDTDESGPLSGECGQLLRCYHEVIGLSRDKNLYITTHVKCRPPANRAPLREERDVCIQLLRQEFIAIRPKIVICAGRSVSRAMIKPDFAPATEFGIFYHKGKTIFVGVPRMYDLLRSPRNKAGAFAYYSAIRGKIGEVCEHTYEPGFLLSHDEKAALSKKSECSDLNAEQKVQQISLV